MISTARACRRNFDYEGKSAVCPVRAGEPFRSPLSTAEPSNFPPHIGLDLSEGQVNVLRGIQSALSFQG
ncbi:hypothetical protein COMA2_100066 [Candidatus Nitrospira nitrificans]|uniref:Uncharacterized protein n=1 Tax=Candidatus Nitrospira nitrificans TaxID=1742973 RepID=A0A0S4L4D0_9BACT|nr:hypothetical protein COMA2_100066 [Candidatus Nitrospira nitrificans]